MTKEKKITIWLILFAIIVFVWYIITKPSAIEQLYKAKAEVIEMRLKQESIRSEAQAKIDAYNEQIQIIDVKLKDAINGTTTIIQTGGLEQASQPQVVIQ